MFRPVFRLPYFEDEFFDVSTQTGLSLSEDDAHVYVEAHLSGIRSEDIAVSYEGGMIWVHGEKKEEDEKMKYYRKASSSFSY